MDNKIKILLGSEKNSKSVNVDTFHKIELTNNVSEIIEYNVNDVVDSTEQFDIERQTNQDYRIYGKIEYLSLLNGLKNDYLYLKDFFVPQTSGNSKNIFNSFRFYLVRPSESGYTNMDNTTKYIRCFKVVATPSNFELYKAGFNTNLYGEQTYGFSFNKDFDVATYFDGFGFPITELFLYAEYIETHPETMSQLIWDTAGNLNKIDYSVNELNIDDMVESNTGYVIGDVIDYNKEDFSYTQVSGQTIFIKTGYLKEDLLMGNLEWSYNPFVPIRLRYLGDELYVANTGSTSYDILNSIPDYATKLDDNGNYVWREISDQGYIEPLSAVGIDYPFLNGKRYLFKTFVFSVMPNLSEDETLKHQTTLDVFNEISYGKNILEINKLPSTDLDNIGKPCA